MTTPCIFCSIVAGQAEASVVHRDDLCLAFMDLHPVNPGHLLVVPLDHATYLADLPAATGAHMFTVAQQLAARLRRSGLRADGVNVFLADGEAAGQEVCHVHLHVIPRFAGDGFGLTFGPSYGQPVPRERLDRDAAAITAGNDDVHGG